MENHQDTQQQMMITHAHRLVGETKRERKDLKRATRLVGKAKPMQCLPVGCTDEKVIQAHRRKHVTADVIEAKFLPVWNAQKNDIQTILDECFELSDGSKNIKGDPELRRTELASQVASRTSDLIEGIKETCRRFELEVPEDKNLHSVVLPCYIRGVLHIIPDIILQRSIALGLDRNYEDCIYHSTVGLEWSAHLKCKHPFAKPPVRCVNLLFTRAEALGGMDRFEDAIRDYHAAVAAMRLYNSDDEWHQAGGCCGQYPKHKLVTATRRLLVLRALQKLRTTTPRPHYDLAERIKLTRQLGLGMYTKEIYKCGFCGEAGGDLKLCGGCNFMWFCSKECQKHLWKAGHKQVCCHSSMDTALVRPKMMDSIQDDIKNQGYSLTSNSFGTLVVVRDPVTGELFDSLQNFDIVVSSENGHNPTCPCCQH